MKTNFVSLALNEKNKKEYKNKSLTPKRNQQQKREKKLLLFLRHGGQ